jgi:hypothetical protein
VRGLHALLREPQNDNDTRVHFCAHFILEVSNRGLSGRGSSTDAMRPLFTIQADSDDKRMREKAINRLFNVTAGVS